MRPVHVLSVDLLRRVHLLLLQPLDEVVVEDMAEWSVSEIMAQTRNRHVSHFVVCDMQVILLLLQDAHLLPGQVAGAD